MRSILFIVDDTGQTKLTMDGYTISPAVFRYDLFQNDMNAIYQLVNNSVNIASVFKPIPYEN
jgi:hypothetical protein